jgi:tRNA-splicing ligase RtcB (3'-phosphate/5'-hydroxy nucleic acid ligase)
MEKITDKLLNWASLLDERTRSQAVRTSTMPFVYPHLALMPDAHLGKGATVGSVIPTLRAVMPAAVGVDIGCGMIAVRTEFIVDDLAGRPLAPLRQSIERAVPLSAGGRNQKLTATATARVAELEAVPDVEPERYLAHWREQLGSLGSGTTSSRSAETKRIGYGCSCTPDLAESATRSPSITPRSPAV